VVTLSDSGIALFDRHGNRSDYPTKKREVIDVTGAGDTVLATLVMALANHFSLDEALPLANIAAGIAVERLGCARVSLADLTHALFTEHRNNKIFDHEHLSLLERALEGKPYKMIYYDKPFSLTLEQLLYLNHLSESETLVAVLSDDALQPNFIEMLSLLEPIDFIIEQSPVISV
jgi:D-beta-D-heptose 7-phosphate kinase/D-beta-D-heptose 1-phosphate adenosyltransferase